MASAANGGRRYRLGDDMGFGNFLNKALEAVDVVSDPIGAATDAATEKATEVVNEKVTEKVEDVVQDKVDDALKQ